MSITRAICWIAALATASLACSAATEAETTPLTVAPAMLSGPLNFFASPAGLKFSEPLPYGIANNTIDNGWIWPNDNTGRLVIDFGAPTALARFRVYSTYPGGRRGAMWSIYHSSDRVLWTLSTPFLFETRPGGGLNDNGSPRTDYAGWYEAQFNPGAEPYRYWQVAQTTVTANHAPRAGQVQFFQHPPPPAVLSLSIRREGDTITLAWVDPLDTAQLQSAEATTGPWATVPGAFSPHVVVPSNAGRFYRLRSPGKG